VAAPAYFRFAHTTTGGFAALRTLYACLMKRRPTNPILPANVLLYNEYLHDISIIRLNKARKYTIKIPGNIFFSLMIKK